MAASPANGRRVQHCTGPSAECATLLAEQFRNEPLPLGGGFERMARRRYQKPAPKKRGEQWTILVREDVVINGQRTRRVKRIVLGPATLTRADAERLRDGVDFPTILAEARKYHLTLTIATQTVSQLPDPEAVF